MAKKKNKHPKRSTKAGNKPTTKLQKSVSTKPSQSTQRNEPIRPFLATYKWAILILLVTTALVYGQTAGYDFVLDDSVVITKNNFTKEGVAGIGKIFTTEGMAGRGYADLLVGARYRPLSLALFALEYELFELNPGPYHIMNVLWYVLLGVILMLTLHELFPSKRPWYWSIPFLAAALYLWHPIHIEAVANIKGRDEILCAALSLLTLWAANRYTTRNSLPYLGATLVLFFLAILAKENALTFLGVIPLTLYWFKRGSQTQWIKLGFGMLAVVLIYLMIRVSIVGYLFNPPGKEITDIMNNPHYGMSFSTRMATVLYTFWIYLKLLIFPHPLTSDYYPYQVAIQNWRSPIVLSMALLHLVGLGWALRQMFSKTTRNPLAWAILFYLMTLFITSNIPFTVGSFMNERFIFISSIAFSIACAYGLVKLWGKQQVLAYSFLGILALGYAYKNMDRIPDWRNKRTLNTSAVKYSPNSARSHCFYMIALWELDYQEAEGPMKDSLLSVMRYHIDRSLEINPNYGSAMTMLGGVATEEWNKDRDTKKLLSEFDRILAVRPFDDFVYQWAEYLTTKNVDPAMVGDWCMQVGYEMLYKRWRNYPLAEKYLNVALNNDRNKADYYYVQGLIYKAQGKSEASKYFEQSLRVDPSLSAKYQ